MSVPKSRDPQAEYQEYLARFESAIGPAEVGAFVKYNGELVQKLSWEDFEPRMREYLEVSATYLAALERGDTMNDMIVKLLRKRAAELFLPNPV